MWNLKFLDKNYINHKLFENNNRNKKHIDLLIY